MNDVHIFNVHENQQIEKKIKTLDSLCDNVDRASFIN